MSKAHGFGAQSATSPLAPINFERRELRPHDVQIEILFCGVCHSDIHTVRNEWKNSVYPVIPGHEIVGRVTKVGSDVKLFHTGEIVAAGTMVDSCRKCPSCKEGLQQYCERGSTMTYNGRDRIDGSITYGGYSNQIIIDETFVLNIPKTFKEADYAGIAPLLCAGITTYSPLRHWKIGNGTKVGVVGLGGLGHMALKLAHAMGAHVVLFTTSKNKIEDAKRLGADKVVLSNNPEEMKKYTQSLDFIINTVSVAHNLDIYLNCLARDATMCLVGYPENPHPTPNIGNLIFYRKALAGSLVGGIKETQEMLEFCAQHHVLSDVEVISIDKINEAYERMLKSDVKYRFVIDMASLKS